MSKKDIVVRLQKAGFALFDARPFPYVVLPYDIDRNAHVRKLTRLLPGCLHDDMSSNNGLCSEDRVEGYNLVLIGVRMTHHDRYSLIAHEVYHAVNFIYKRSGAFHDANNDEHAAYFIQDTYRQTLATLLGYAS